MKRWMVAYVGLAAAALPAEGAERLTLVRDGRPAAAIVLARQPTRAAQLAAYEVQHHIHAITGATLPLVREGEPVDGTALYIGETEAARAAGLTRAHFGPQQYAIKPGPRCLFLVGRDDPATDPVVYDLTDPARCRNLPGFWEEQGTLHAAYDFLERYCGVRWLNPTDLGTICPKQRTLVVRPREFRRAPAFQYRDAVGATGDNPGLYDEYVALWTKDTPQYRQWQELAYADLRQRCPDPEAARRVLAHLFLLRMRNGGEVQRCNHSLYGYYDRYWRDPATRRPELFAKGYEGEPPQMCYTNRALIAQVAQDARDYYDRKKTGAELGIFFRPQLPNWFPIEPMDNGSYCKCPDCQALLREDTGGGFSTGVYSDYFFRFVNEVVRELHRTHPDRGVVTLAYASHALPPAKVKLDPSVAVQFCFTTNRAAGGPDPREVQLLQEWGAEAKRSGRPLFLWLYYTFPVETARNSNLHCWPGFFAHAIGEQMRLFHRLGYRGMFHCGFGQEVEAYVTFKLMDDPSRDVDQLLDDYFTGLYGAAAVPMKRLYLEIERTHAGKAEGYTPTRLAELEALLAQARARAQTEREQRAVALFEVGTWSYLTEGLQQRERVKAAAIPTVTVPRLAAAGGDASRLAWEQAAPLPGPWYQSNSDRPANRKLSGRIAHDGRHLYLELGDACDPTTLQSSAMVFPYDDWEIFVAAQRGQPYRQYALNPKGLKVALSHGEVNFRQNVPLEPAPFTVVSDVSAPDRWVARVVWPLAEVVPGGVTAGGKLYLNIVRVAGPTPQGGFGIDAWGPFTRVHDVSRLPELTLE
ncbi:MAG: DUF4838 domain-containing protein [Armatimonadetes bacterium]|nr:DUF4838 domain-containing protein [Armatimonadota bacterium]